MTGHGLHWGVSDAIYPEAAAAANTSVIYADEVKTAISRVHDLKLIAHESCNWLVVGERLMDIDAPDKKFKELVSKLVPGAHVVLALPQLQQPKHVSFFSYSKVEELLNATGKWIIKDYQTRFSTNLIIAKYLGPGHKVTHAPLPTGKRACIVRYGAIGDLIMVTPLIRALHEDGYTVTMNVSTYSEDAITNNPYVANKIPHERNIVENHELGAYWAVWASEYDKYINLSESIEGSLLKIEARRDFYTPKASREAACSENYLDKTMRLGGYPDASKRQELFFSPQENAWADKFLAPYKGKFTIAWGLNGSSFHKRYAILEPVLKSWLADKPDAQVFLLGNDVARLMQFEHPQVRGLAGDIKLRQAFALLPKVNLVAGPESALINAASCYGNPKVVLLSHSSESNLCTHWVNYTALKPSAAVAPCYPCHQMHSTLESCPIIQLSAIPVTTPMPLSGPCCSMGAISAESVHAALDAAYSDWKVKML